MMKIFLKIILMGMLASILFSCGKEEDKFMYTNPVNFKVDVDVQDIVLKIPGNTKSFIKPRLADEYVGYGGLLVVCGLNAITPSTYQLYAYDLACPQEKQFNVLVKVVNNKAKCDKCGSEFDILSGVGSVVSGPAKDGLQRYKATYVGQGGGVFRITR